MPDNPAERLSTVLLSLKENPNETEKQAWERVSGATGIDLLLQRVAEASALVGEVEQVFLNHPDREHYMSWAPAVQSVFTELAFRTSVGGRVAGALSEITLERLRNCAVRVSEMDLGPVLNEKGIIGLVAKLDVLIKEATKDTELDNDVREFVVQQCVAIQAALKTYAITGNRGLRLAAEASIGRWFTSPGIAAKVPRGVVEGFREVIMRILNSAVTQTAAKQLQGAVERLLSSGGGSDEEGRTAAGPSLARW